MNRSSPKGRSEGGFSLVEVVAVLAVVGLLATIGFRAPSTFLARRSLRSALENFFLGLDERVRDGNGPYFLMVGTGSVRDLRPNTLALVSRRGGRWQRTQWQYRLPGKWRVIASTVGDCPPTQGSWHSGSGGEAFCDLPGHWQAIELWPEGFACLLVFTAGEDGTPLRVQLLNHGWTFESEK